MPLVSGLLSLGPRIRKDENRLIAVTGWRVGLLTLGTMLRRVEVDAASKTVLIHSRYLWLFQHTRSLRFRDIEAVTYGYSDWSPGEYLSFAHDAIDVYGPVHKFCNTDIDTS